MPKGGTFGTTSRTNLEKVHPDLVRLAEAVVKVMDCTVTDGWRSIAEQKKNILKGVSKTLDSKHLPRDENGELFEDGVAWAIDIIPYLTNWPLVQKGLDAMRRADPTMQVARHYLFIGVVIGVASQLGINIRPGADWDEDGEVGDHSFIDLPHIELDITPDT